MNAWKSSALAAAGLAALVSGAVARGPASAQAQVNWLTDVEAARAAARQSGKPICLVFR